MVVRIVQMNGVAGCYWCIYTDETGYTVTLSVPEKLVASLIQQCLEGGIEVYFQGKKVRDRNLTRVKF